MVQFIEDAEPVAPAPSVAEPARPLGTPWHLWAVGGVSLLWNAVGALDYTMSQLRNRAYLEAGTQGTDVTADQMIAYLDSFPAWSNIFWGLGVWGAIAGSILLLLRSRFAVWAFGASLFGLAVTTAYHASAPKPDWADQPALMTIALWSIATFLLIYSASMKTRNVLK